MRYKYLFIVIVLALGQSQVYGQILPKKFTIDIGSHLTSKTDFVDNLDQNPAYWENRVSPTYDFALKLCQNIGKPLNLYGGVGLGWHHFEYKLQYTSKDFQVYNGDQTEWLDFSVVYLKFPIGLEYNFPINEKTVFGLNAGLTFKDYYTRELEISLGSTLFRDSFGIESVYELDIRQAKTGNFFGTVDLGCSVYHQLGKNYVGLRLVYSINPSTNYLPIFEGRYSIYDTGGLTAQGRFLNYGNHLGLKFMYVISSKSGSLVIDDSNLNLLL